MPGRIQLLVRDVERDLVPAMQAYELGLIPYFPLASGLLSGKYKRNAPLPEGTRLANTARLAERYLTEANWDRVERLREFSEARGRSLLDVAFAWLLAKPQVATVIAGATKPEQVEQNVAAAEWMVNPDDLKEDRTSFDWMRDQRFPARTLALSPDAAQSDRYLEVSRARR
jgi:aryl-alcohol dehydrogenase-like predicted oxidoreductase